MVSDLRYDDNNDGNDDDDDVDYDERKNVPIM